MCQRITCENCNKPTWKGCGEHIEQALEGVPMNERCSCSREVAKVKKGGILARFKKS